MKIFNQMSTKNVKHFEVQNVKRSRVNHVKRSRVNHVKQQRVNHVKTWVVGLAFLGVSISAALAQPYIITGSGTSFTATKSGVTLGALVGGNQPIATVIGVIRLDAGGANCTIQFGSGSSGLGIGTSNITFNGTWGTITLTGWLMSSNSNASSGAVVIAGNVSVINKADISCSSASGNAIYSSSTGTLTISDGNIRGGVAIVNASTGTLNITGGKVQGYYSLSRAIYNTSSGAVNISGGEVYTSDAIAIDNGSTGKITVSGNAQIYSYINNDTYGTIFLNNSGTSTATRLEITGGTVEKRSSTSSYYGNAIRNNSSGEVKISGGTVSTNGYGVAIWNNNTGALTINGGTVAATGSYNGYGRAIYNVSSGAININGGTVSSGDAIAIDNASTGKITMTGGTVTSANKNTGYSTIFLNGSGTSTTARLEIFAGTVRNTVAGGNAIRNNSTGAVTIGRVGFPLASIATVSATTGVAVWNNSTGSLTVNCSGNLNSCTVSATTGRAIYNASTGKITVSGSNTTVTSANTAAGEGTIVLNSSGTATGTRLEITGGTVRNTAAASNAIRNGSTGAITISGGTVSATTGNVVLNASTGTVNISGGTVSATGTGGRAVVNSSTATVNISGGTVSSTNWVAVDNSSTGAVNISGGTVRAVAGIAVWNNSTGKITVSGTALVTSENNGLPQNGTFKGTIRLASSGTATALRLEITGGTVQNTSTSGTNAHAIANASTGGITISGGMVLAKNGYAVYRESSTGTITFSKGIVFAYGTAATNVISVTYSGASNNSVLVAWDKAAGTTNYAEGSNLHIFKTPATGTGAWQRQGTVNGILVAAGTTTGFIPVEGVTIGGVVTNYTVSFAGDEINIPSQTIEHGQKVSKPADPTRAGYNFGGWFTDNGIFANQWNFTTDIVTSDLTLWAKWSVVPNIVSVTVSPETVFLQPEETQQFIVTVVAEGDADDSVTWSISGNQSTSTTITNDGLLTLGANETDGTITVRATSVFDPTVFGEATAIVSTVGIKDLEITKMAVYPNPTTGQLTLKLSDMKLSDIQLYDMVGKLQDVKIGQPDSGQSEITIDISHLPAGIYFVKVGYQTVKVIKY